MSNPLLARLTHHINAAIERGEEPVLERRYMKAFTDDEMEPSASIRVVCHNTGQTVRWNDAVRAGWTYDYNPNRTPHTHYYSPHE